MVDGAGAKRKPGENLSSGGVRSHEILHCRVSSTTGQQRPVLMTLLESHRLLSRTLSSGHLGLEGGRILIDPLQRREMAIEHLDDLGELEINTSIST